MQTQALQKSIEEAVDRLEPSSVDLLRALVQTPSITGAEQQAQHLIAERLAGMGLEVDAWSPTRGDVELHPAFSDDGLPLGDRPVVVARWRGTQPGAPSLILNGHMDV